MVLYNTEAEFKAADKQHFLTTVQDSFMVMFVFADLKRHLFKYQMAFPCRVSKEDIKCVSLFECEVGKDVWFDAASRELVAPNQLVFSWPVRHRLSKLQQNGDTAVDIDVHKFRKTYRLSLTLPASDKLIWFPGWEKDSDRPALKTVDLAPLMDPLVLAKESSDLNLKLMKWRLVPELDLNAIQSKRCLLFGAGTLGCNVTRCLLVLEYIYKLTLFRDGE